VSRATSSKTGIFERFAMFLSSSLEDWEISKIITSA